MFFLSSGFNIALKSVFSIIILFCFTKIMGKKQISQLTCFDYIVGITIGSIAASVCVDRRISVIDGFFSMMICALFPIVFSRLSIHSITIRRWVSGTPTMLIEQGKIIENNLKKSNLSINDLLEELRMKNIFNIMDVEYAILETGWRLSILVKSEKQPITPADIHLTVQPACLYANVIIDGQLMYENMRQIHLTSSELFNKLRNQKVNLQDVLLGCCNLEGKLQIMKKNITKSSHNVFQ